MRSSGKRWVCYLWALAFSLPGIAAESFYVTAPDGVPLAVTAQGPEGAPEVLLIHGTGHGRESFSHQFESPLLADYRLVAFDMRGHGQSGKPWTEDGYNNPQLWADDVKTVMEATGLTRPIMVGWSYSGFVVVDYIRIYGTQSMSGLVMANSLGGLIDASGVTLKPEADMIEAYQLLGEPSFRNQRRAVDLIAPFLVAKEVDPEWDDRVRQLGMMLPPYVRPLLRSHPKSNLDVTERVDIPLLIIHGAKDGALPVELAEKLEAAVPGARRIPYAMAAHTPFAEEPARFNEDLRAFIESIWIGGEAAGP